MKSAIEKQDAPRQYREEDRFGLFVQKSGGIMFEDWLMLPQATKEKLSRLHKGLKMMKDRTYSIEVAPMVEGLGMKDVQRFLFMLFQGGYLTRDRDTGHRIIHVKTDLAMRLNDEELAADMFSKNKKMFGYPVVRRTKPTRKKTEHEEVDGDLDVVPGEPSAPEVPFSAEQADSETSEPRIDAPKSDLLHGLDQADALMVEDLIRVLKVTRQLMPRLSRKDFLLTFAKGSKYVED